MKYKLKLGFMCFLLCGQVSAQSANYTEKAPFSGVFSGDCSTETVAVSGTLITNIILMFNDNVGIVQFHTKESNDTFGVGLVSQAQYKVSMNQFASFRFDKNVMVDTGLMQKFTLKGPSDLTISYILRARFDQETQQFKTSFEKLDVSCK